MKRNEHIASLKAMIRQTEKDLAKMKHLLDDMNQRLEPKGARKVHDRKKTPGR